jgi:hypothetical protein
VSDGALDQTTSEINKAKRPLSLSVGISVLHGSAEIVLQVTNCGTIFKTGFLPLILGKITI